MPLTPNDNFIGADSPSNILEERLSSQRRIQANNVSKDSSWFETPISSAEKKAQSKIIRREFNESIGSNMAKQRSLFIRDQIETGSVQRLYHPRFKKLARIAGVKDVPSLWVSVYDSELEESAKTAIASYNHGYNAVILHKNSPSAAEVDHAFLHELRHAWRREKGLDRTVIIDGRKVFQSKDPVDGKWKADIPDPTKGKRTNYMAKRTEKDAYEWGDAMAERIQKREERKATRKLLNEQRKNTALADKPVVTKSTAMRSTSASGQKAKALMLEQETGDVVAGLTTGVIKKAAKIINKIR